MSTRVLIIAATAVLAAVAVHAQNGPAKAGPYNGADRASVLRDIGIAHGMLRGLQYAAATTTAQFQATGTQYIVGQAFKPGGPWPAVRLTKNNGWINNPGHGRGTDSRR